MASCPQLTNHFRELVFFRFEFLIFTNLDFFAFSFQRVKTRGIEGKAARSQALGDKGCVFAQQLNIKHGSREEAPKPLFSTIAAACG